MNFKTEPYKHQLDVFNRHKDSEYFALFADMGTGKTKVCIDIAAYRFQQSMINAVLVIAPNNVHSQWVNEQFPIHCSVPYKPFLWYSAMKTRRIYAKQLEAFMLADYPNHLKVFAVNVETFQSATIIPMIAEYVKNHRPYIIVDESTRIKNPEAKRSTWIHKLAKYGYRTILTGTPTTKSPLDLWSQFEFLKNNYFDCNYFVFQHRYSIMMQKQQEIMTPKGPRTSRYHTLIDEKNFKIVKAKLDTIALTRNGTLMPDDYEAVHIMTGVSEKNIRFIAAQEVYVKYKRLDELRAIIAKDTVAIKKGDCLDLPPKVYESIEIDMPKELRKVYNTLKQQLLVEYEGHELTVLNKIALTTRLMQICGGFFPYDEEGSFPNGKTFLRKKQEPIGKKNVKLETLLADYEETDGQVIVWAQFVPELKMLHAAFTKLDCRCSLYYGKVGQIQRDKIKADFQRGEIDVFIGNAATAGFGLNLQNSTLQMYYSNSFSTEQRLQAEDRSHRMGVRSTCVYKDYVYKKSLDEKIYKCIQEGRDLNDFFTQPLTTILEEE